MPGVSAVYTHAMLPVGAGGDKISKYLYLGDGDGVGGRGRGGGRGGRVKREVKESMDKKPHRDTPVSKYLNLANGERGVGGNV